VFMCVHVCSCVFMCVHVCSCVFMCVHVCSCVFMCVHVCSMVVVVWYRCSYAGYSAAVSALLKDPRTEPNLIVYQEDGALLTALDIALKVSFTNYLTTLTIIFIELTLYTLYVTCRFRKEVRRRPSYCGMLADSLLQNCSSLDDLLTLPR
jgi:hypothetical protein